MIKTIPQKKAREYHAALRIARRKLKIAMGTLREIAGGFECYTPGCACIEDLRDHYLGAYCDVGNAKVALKLIKELGK